MAAALPARGFYKWTTNDMSAFNWSLGCWPLSPGSDSSLRSTKSNDLLLKYWKEIAANGFKKKSLAAFTYRKTGNLLVWRRRPPLLSILDDLVKPCSPYFADSPHLVVYKWIVDGRVVARDYQVALERSQSLAAQQEHIAGFHDFICQSFQSTYAWGNEAIQHTIWHHWCKFQTQRIFKTFCHSAGGNLQLAGGLGGLPGGQGWSWQWPSCFKGDGWVGSLASYEGLDVKSIHQSINPSSRPSLGPSIRQGPVEHCLHKFIPRNVCVRTAMITCVTHWEIRGYHTETLRVKKI